VKPLIVKIGLLFAVSFALSATWIACNPQQLNRSRPDAILFQGIAANLAAGHGFSFDKTEPFRPEITRTPFLPLVGAAIFVIAGNQRNAVLWINAVLVALAVALSFVVARELFAGERAAYIGAWVVCLTPQVSGSANAFLTEAPAMLQVILALWMLLKWPAWRAGRRAPLLIGALGLLLASIVLNRPNLTPLVLVAAAWTALHTMRGRWRDRRSWIVVIVLAFTLGTPVLGWSARNASLGLAFTPMAVGKGAGYVYEVSRFREALLEEGDRLPAEAQRRFWGHYRRPLGPDQLIELDRQNMDWFSDWIAERWGRVVRATPERLLALFSQDRVSIYRQPWPYRLEAQWTAAARGLSRALWLLSAAGLVLVWRRRRARVIWLVAIGGTALFALISACNPRYLTPLLPLAMPFVGVVLDRLWSAVRRRSR
jgi:4-amino-4-deoxy-L-arabinose transferase-like glycosyltransferase